MVEKSKRKAFGEHVSISDWLISFYCVGQLNELKFYAMSALGYKILRILEIGNLRKRKNEK